MIFSRFKWNEFKLLELTGPLKAYVYFKNYRHNLLTGFPEVYKIEKFQNDLENIKLQTHVKSPHVFHFLFEYGLMQELGVDSVSDETPLVIELEYSKSKFKEFKKLKKTEIDLKFLQKPSWTEYKEAFARVQEELLAGNAYQVNLTCPYDFYTDDLIDPRDICDTFFSKKNLGRYAHSTFLGEELILSNSPECLFQFKDKKLITMPIKGTIPLNRGDIKTLWKELLNSPKEKAELLMISDLLKNDLNRIDKAIAKVVKLRSPLVVPGLLHQYSLISVLIENQVSLLKVMQCLFPGGSITGAPKKRVLEIIKAVENFNRSHYCGSTLLCYKNQKVASINIRTAQIQWEERIWKYGAGGGITLLSKNIDEFKEMEAKALSFYELFKRVN